MGTLLKMHFIQLVLIDEASRKNMKNINGKKKD